MKVRLFDVCVVGRGLGGLMAALILQKRGLKVSVVTDKKERAFDPSVCEFLNGFTIKPMLKRVGFHPTEVNAIPSLEAPLQLVFEHHRLDCFGDEKKFERELRREFPDRGQKILKLFKEKSGHLEIYQHIFNSRVPLPPKGFFAKRQFARVLRSISDESELKSRILAKELRSFDVGDDFSRAVEAMELALTGLVNAYTSSAQLAHLLTLVRWEGYLAAAGPSTVKEMLLSKFREHGGIVVDADQIKEILTTRKRVDALRLTGAEWDEVQCSVLVVAGDPRGLMAFQPEARMFRKWKNELNELPVLARKAYQLLRIRPEGIPVGMQPQGLLIPKAAPGGMYERRKVIRAIRYVLRPQGDGKSEVHVGLTVFLPPDGARPDRAHLQEEISENLKTLIPFVDRYQIEPPAPVYVPSPEGVAGDFREGSVYTSSSPRTLGVQGIGPESPGENVFLAGEMVFPGLGLDGEVIAGQQVTYYVSKALSTYKSKI